MRFEVDDRVEIYNTESFLDGKAGTILGVSVDMGYLPGWSTYIVLLDNPTPTHKAITITNACIRPME